MKNKILISLSVIFTILISCKKETITEPSQPQNLISNSSFEINGNASIDGWVYWCNSASNFEYSNDVPPSAGNWSVLLYVGDKIIKTLETTIKAPIGQNRYRLSVWAKAKWTNPRGTPGTMSLILNGNLRKSIALKDSIWNYYEIVDTLTISTTDTLKVRLNSGTAYGYQQTYFDLCRLELLK